MIEDPHFKARDAIIDIEHPEFGLIKMQNVAPKLSKILEKSVELAQV